MVLTVSALCQDGYIRVNELTYCHSTNENNYRIELILKSFWLVYFFFKRNNTVLDFSPLFSTEKNILVHWFFNLLLDPNRSHQIKAVASFSD